MIRALKFLTLLIPILFATALIAETCRGENLLGRLSDRDRAAVDEATAKVPYAQGIHFEVTRDGKRSVLYGTFHMPEEILGPTPPAILTEIAAARVFVMEITRNRAPD